jgi:hypothetical protein
VTSCRPRACREVRWFLDDDVPMSMLPSGRSRTRADRYDVTSLRPWSSVKQRGRAVLERKERVGRVELVTVGGLVGFVETWQKVRRRRVPDADGWLEVRKQMWFAQEVEIACVEVGDTVAWTVCIDVTCPASVAGRAALDRWWAPLRRHGQPSSYAAWLGERFGPVASRARPAVGQLSA